MAVRPTSPVSLNYTSCSKICITITAAIIASAIACGILATAVYKVYVKKYDKAKARQEQDRLVQTIREQLMRIESLKEIEDTESVTTC